MKIAIRLHDAEYTVETPHDDYNSDELKEIFSQMMVAAGYPPTVIEIDEGGRFEYVGDDEIVIKKEEIQNAE